ncbi:MAG: hypothetical protein LBS18_08190, partial [Clostridiales bacterium]|nr:hypothetical protein [Clostridiales bacterium]
PDDTVSLLFRRAGLKSVLAKDAYCYHFGSVTIKEDIEKKAIDKQRGYEKGREDFKRAFGIDPWGTGFCYDPVLFQSFACKLDGPLEILGINCGMGSNSLKIKELYKEHKHNLDVYLTNIVSDERVLRDALGVSDAAVLGHSPRDIPAIVKEKRFHYIVLEDPWEGKTHSIGDIDFLAEYLLDDGELYVKSKAQIISKKLKKPERMGNWLMFANGESEGFVEAHKGIHNHPRGHR